MKEKKYTQEDIAMVLNSFCLNHEEESQRDMFVDILRKKKVKDLKKTASALHDLCTCCDGREEQAAKYLNDEYNMSL